MAHRPSAPGPQHQPRGWQAGREIFRDGDGGEAMTRRFYDLMALAQTQGVRQALKAGLAREEGQDGIEYALVAAVVVVAVVAALKTGFPGDVISTAVSKVSGAMG